MKEPEYNKEETIAIFLGCGALMHILEWILIIVLLASCAGPSKIQTVKEREMKASIGIPDYEMLRSAQHDSINMPDYQKQEISLTDGSILMRAETDENGEMVARDRIIPSVVVARFRNIAERGGKVNIEFEIRVPEGMLDELWQLRFYPVLEIPGPAGNDVKKLEPVYITGTQYRESQLKGYERYNRFITSIITDSTRFISLKALELFIQRNIPDLYAFKQDSTLVSEAQFTSVFGVTEQEAIDHYTRKLSKRLNARRAARSSAMYCKYIPVPIVSEGIRLDTVIRADEEFVYLYRETIPARDGKKKAKLSVSGKIFELNKAIYTIPPTDTLTYYISSLTAFIDNALNPHDAKYRDGLAALRGRDYKRAVTLLQSYQDLNTALAYLEMDYNGTARIILENLPDSENVLYLKAVVYARTGREEQAQAAFLKACELKPAFWHRGNLDPEISYIVQRFNLSNTQSINF